MPQVPVAPLPSVDLQPQRTANYTADDFGAPTGRAMMQVGQTLQNTGELVARHVEERKREEDTTAVLGAQAKLQDANRKALYDENGGLLTTRGTQTDGIVEQAQERFKAARAEAAAGLKGDAATKFAQIAQRTEQSNLDVIYRHRSTEFTRAKDETQQALITSSALDAANGYRDPEIIQRSLNTAQGAVMANAKGMPEPALKQALLAARSTVHTSVIDRLIVEDPRAAADYYQKNKEDIYGGDHAKITRTLKPALQGYEVDDHYRRITGTNSGVVQLGDAIGSVGPAAPDVSLAPGAPIRGSRISAGVEAITPSVVRAETGGRARNSPAGAAGVMQVMPDTAIEISTKMLKDGLFPPGTPKERIQEALNANKGLATRYGQAYLQQMSDRYHGDVEAVLVAYNAGPGNADKWLKAGRDYGALPKPEETEPYVTKVLEHFTGKAGGTAGTQARGAAGAGWGELPPPGRRMTRENWGLEFYKPDDLIAKTEAGAWVDARAATMADILGKSFFERTGIRVAINDSHDTPGTSGKRRGTRDPHDNPGATGSQHLHGRAFDFQIQNLNDEQKADFLRTARSLGFAGVGFYPNGHIHLDSGSPRTWGTAPGWAAGAMATAPAPLGAFGVSGVATRGEGRPGPVYSMPGTVPTNAVSGVRMGPITQDFAPAGIPGALPDASAGGVGIPAAPFPTIQPTTRGAAPTERDLSGWLAQANEIADPAVRQAVLGKISAEHERRKKVHGEQQTAAYEDGFRKVLGGAPASSISPEQMLSMGPEKARQLLTFAEKRDKGQEPPQDWGLWAKLATMPDEELKKTSLYDYRNSFDNQHFDKLASRYQAITAATVAEGAAATAAQQSARDKLTGVRGRTDLVEDALREVAGDTRLEDWKKRPENMAIAGRLNSRLDDVITEHTQRTGKAPNPDEVRKMLDGLMIRTFKSDGVLWDTGAVRAFQLEPEEVGSTVPEKAYKTYKDVPVRDRVDVGKFWQESTGKKINEGELVKLYPQIVRAKLGLPQVEDPPMHEAAELKNALKRTLQRDPTKEEIRTLWGRALTKRFGGN